LACKSKSLAPSSTFALVLGHPRGCVMRTWSTSPSKPAPGFPWLPLASPGRPLPYPAQALRGPSSEASRRPRQGTNALRAWSSSAPSSLIASTVIPPALFSTNLASKPRPRPNRTATRCPFQSLGKYPANAPPLSAYDLRASYPYRGPSCSLDGILVARPSCRVGRGGGYLKMGGVLEAARPPRCFYTKSISSPKR
jgi:hypothetical protein